MEIYFHFIFEKHVEGIYITDSIPLNVSMTLLLYIMFLFFSSAMLHMVLSGAMKVCPTCFSFYPFIHYILALSFIIYVLKLTYKNNCNHKYLS